MAFATPRLFSAALFPSRDCGRPRGTPLSEGAKDTRNGEGKSTIPFRRAWACSRRIAFFHLAPVILERNVYGAKDLEQRYNFICPPRFFATLKNDTAEGAFAC